jgi:DNA-binding MarR family transcriptional regulator
MAKKGRRAAAAAPRREKRPGDANAMGRHLVGLSPALRERVAGRLLERGHDLSPSATQVVPNLPVQGLGLSELASRLRLTLQRTGQVLRQLETDGYVERVPDARDGRAKRVVYTRRGLALVRDIDAITEDLRREFEAMLGPARFGRLCRDLAALDAGVNGPDAPLRLPPPAPLRRG